MGNNRQLAKNMVFNIGSFVINLSISFFFTPYLIRVVGKEAYGFFPLANNIVGYSGILTAAINSMASRFIMMRLYGNDLKGANIYFNSVFIANIVLSLFLALCSVFIVLFIDHILTVPAPLLLQVKILFAIAFVSMVFGLATTVLGASANIKNRIDLSSVVTVKSNLLKVLLIVVLFWIFRPSIVYMSIAALGAALLTVFYNVKFKRRLLPEIEINPRKYFSLAAIKEVASSGMWNSINQLSTVLLTQLDLLITNIFIGAAATGDYSIAKMIPVLIQSFVGVLVGVFVPAFTILYAQNKREELLSEIKKSVKIMGLLLTIPIGFLIVYGDVFFSLWVPGQNALQLYMLSNLTIIPMIVTGSINTIFNVYTITNKLKLPAIILLVSGIVNTLCVMLLLKTTSLGIIAIPLVSLVIGLLRNLLFTPLYAAWCLEVKWSTFYISILRGVACAVVVIVFSCICKYIFDVNNWFAFVGVAVLVTIVSLLVNVWIATGKEDIRLLLSKIRKR